MRIFIKNKIEIVSLILRCFPTDIHIFVSYKMKLNLLLFTPMLLGTLACSDGSPVEPEPTPGPDVPEVSVAKTVTIDAGQTFQTMKGFGASDCWTPAYVGKYWTNTREEISELLFSSEIVDGQPKGIGLSFWRVNMGGGSMEQGDGSGIEEPSRRAESYLNADGTYNWSKCEGQCYFMQRAREQGCEDFILFSNTPPVQYTRNGQGRSDSGFSSNLKEDCYDDFAAYMAEVAAHYEGEGYNITHISPVNEPQYEWNGHDQEGSGWQNDEVARLARELDAALTAKGLSTQILLGEAADWEYLYKVKGNAGSSRVLDAFFAPGSSAYVGDLAHVGKLIGGHSYWTDGTWEGMRDVRRQMAQATAQYGLDVWQTEWSMLGDEYSLSEFVGYDNATEMDIALYMTKVIHNDLTVAGVTSWSYWVAMDALRTGHKNRFLLIALNPQGWDGGWGHVTTIAQEGSFRATPTLWALGNYSRFVRPGYKRIGLTLNEDSDFFGSAYISPDGKQIVAVYSNLSDDAVRLEETHIGWSGTPASVKVYTTSATKNLQESVPVADNPVYLDAGSVTTVVYELN